MSYHRLGQEASDDDLERQARAVQAVQGARAELEASLPETVRSIGIGSLVVFGLIYWLLVKR